MEKEKLVGIQESWNSKIPENKCLNLGTNDGKNEEEPLEQFKNAKKICGMNFARNRGECLPEGI